ncbi:spherulation-specific family 4 protein [Streptomyces sp. NBC_00335]|uniref:spherulation-specific family 4 protein n=1 Tax=unclassified Streptomyces TaxID=2593676 RepID=UPI00225571A8|nr:MULTISPECIES: spherulation-specific family 4 protein [unclassified Streptomyces]MCX5404772.1 spherulation-specific family 4 protein [Streptomyces sp. NBC_00086]
MPHLTTPPAAGQAATEVGRLGLGVPGYAHPLLAPVEWAELTRPGTPLHWAVLNVTDGPGGRPDPHCTEAAAKLRGAGGSVLGHLAMRDGERSFGELVSDAHRFRDWYGVDGFYLAQAPAGKAELASVRRVVDTLRGLGEGLRIVLGHGTHPCEGYAETADQLVTFSGTWADYRWSQVAEWTADHPPETFCHLVHGVPRTHLEEALRIARWQGAGTIWFTDRRGAADRDPWASMPGYWDEIVSRIGPGVSE